MTPALYALAAATYDRARARGATPVEAMKDAHIVIRGPRATRAEVAGIPGDIAALIHAVVEAHGSTLAAVRRSRTPWSTLIRSEAIYLARQHSRGDGDLSYKQLARFFDRDHSSLIVGVQKFEARMKVDELLRKRMDRLTRREGRAA